MSDHHAAEEHEGLSFDADNLAWQMHEGQSFGLEHLFTPGHSTQMTQPHLRSQHPPLQSTPSLESSMPNASQVGNPSQTQALELGHLADLSMAPNAENASNMDGALPQLIDATHENATHIPPHQAHLDFHMQNRSMDPSLDDFYHVLANTHNQLALMRNSQSRDESQLASIPHDPHPPYTLPEASNDSAGLDPHSITGASRGTSAPPSTTQNVSSILPLEPASSSRQVQTRSGNASPRKKRRRGASPSLPRDGQAGGDPNATNVAANFITPISSSTALAQSVQLPPTSTTFLPTNYDTLQMPMAPPQLGTNGPPPVSPAFLDLQRRRIADRNNTSQPRRQPAFDAEEISDLLPRDMPALQRAAMISILQGQAPATADLPNPAYIPNTQSHPQRRPSKKANGMKARPRFYGRQGRSWPSGRMPLEIFEIIASYLPHETLKQMRLVNREFERNISNVLFHTVVVPFREEIYGIILRNSKSKSSVPARLHKSDKKSRTDPEKDFHDGMRVFRAWGPHIKKFGMAFEVDEAMLERPPAKGKFETHPTFWGSYAWPHPYYNRFKSCEGLEKKADEFRCMSEALSNLTEVTELALSLDSGLGWINGPDISDRARIFRNKHEIFGRKHSTLAVSMSERQHAWQKLRQLAKPTKRNNGNTADLVRQLFSGLDPQFYVNALATSEGPIEESPVFKALLEQPLIFDGLDLERAPKIESLRTSRDEPVLSPFLSLPLVPNNLTTAQQEWLLETEWAQRAFLSSFCMALCDNADVFRHVKTLNISRLSSRYLPTLDRRDIWTALDHVEKLTIYISPDWRNITKTDGGLVEAPDLKPSTAAALFYALLKNQIAGLSNVKSLSLGYVGGGEHQTGMYGRNKYILPAPVFTFDDIWKTLKYRRLSVENSKTTSNLILPFVEHLTFSNCWFAPGNLKAFVSRMRRGALKVLNLDSVSLTAPTLGSPLSQEGFTGQQDDITRLPVGSPRMGDPAVGNLFELRPHFTPMPGQHGWVTTGLRTGSWGDVINKVTPGADLDLLRYAFQFYDPESYDVAKQKKKQPKVNSLERINFNSCGYVYLMNITDMNQVGIGHVYNTVPDGLRLRFLDLSHGAMGTEDNLLGQIVPTFPPSDEEFLTTGLPMRFGWEDVYKAMENREDCQPPGGSGRFSGNVQRLRFPTEEPDEWA